MDSAAVRHERGAQPGRHVAAIKRCIARGDVSEIAGRFARGHEGRGVAQVGVLAGVWREPQDAARAIRAHMQLEAQAAAAAPEALRSRVAACRALRPATLRNDAPSSDFPLRIENQISIWLSQEVCVGV